jgi:hypothetical protein
LVHGFFIRIRIRIIIIIIIIIIRATATPRSYSTMQTQIFADEKRRFPLHYAPTRSGSPREESLFYLRSWKLALDLYYAERIPMDYTTDTNELPYSTPMMACL